MLNMLPACSTATHTTQHQTADLHAGMGNAAIQGSQVPTTCAATTQDSRVLAPCAAASSIWTGRFLTCDAGVWCWHAPEAPVRLPAILCEHALQHKDSCCQHLQVRSNHLTGASRLSHTAKWHCQEPQRGFSAQQQPADEEQRIGYSALVLGSLHSKWTACNRTCTY